MQVRDIMTRDVCLLAPHGTLREPAQQMRTDNIGSRPVADGDRLEGYVTDRDMVVRRLDQGLWGDTYDHDGMSGRVPRCFEDKRMDDLAADMAQNRVRRLPVISRGKRLFGIVALGGRVPKAGDVAADGASKPRW